MGRAAALVAIAGTGALAWWLINRPEGGGVYAPVDLDFSGLAFGDWTGWDAPAPATVTSSGDYFAALSRAEDPTGDPYAKNPYSTASGLYQFTKPTWTRLGGDWGDDPSQAFGGLMPSPALQLAMAQKLTAQNAGILNQIGAAVNNATLYTMHIFGAGTGQKVVKAVANALPSTPLTALPGVSQSIVKINPALGSTVGSFLSYLTRKVGT